MAAKDRLTFVGELWAVTIEDGDGSERFVEVSPAVLGVARGVGLVTSDTRKDLTAGVIHRSPSSGRAQVLRSVWYYRTRLSGRWWFHETPRALVTFDGEGPDGLPFCFVDSRGSVPCGAGDFICN